ncbi:hypothetical protein [Flagellimonas zhangzhouensis]|uniref:Uncharacterized protein n=1 Tax=Flagellimonas zhangzhouensis TaxID=1073328 RepID=A0A1H2UL11_9FLAO|nr:hypothetical protein [Allomuricauda zhangzhouensis]SDQ16018.1 hypothetical protein SAMN05216294_0646 [Allomuricauda zhangzhouensis]SDW56876.1 hypothetical protein SAMN04487892_1647 [Allomuricauda zhangzhouensis]
MRIAGWIFALLILAIGLINTFWGNDPGYGIFDILASSVFFKPATDFLAKKTGVVIPIWIKVILALLILWTALGVAELFDKIDLMVKDFA